MGQQNEVNYNERTVDEWVKRARDGRVAVADFQRSFVWPAPRAARYINAVLRGRPVGVFLILNSAPSPQFSPRPFSNMDTPLEAVEELVLDGQQRLTSLLHALYGHPNSRFFIEVQDFDSGSLALKGVVAYGKNSAEARKRDKPADAYRCNCIPIDALRRADPKGGAIAPLSRWCGEVWDKVKEIEGSEEFLRFHSKIIQFVEEFFFSETALLLLAAGGDDPAGGNRDFRGDEHIVGTDQKV